MKFASQILLITATANLMLAAGTNQQGVPSQPARQVAPQAVAPPQFRFYKFEPGLPDVYIVPQGTTDAQLVSLLRLFRKSVKSNGFADIGINRPTDPLSGTSDYAAGTLLVYRGSRCADEAFTTPAQAMSGSLGPCGYGEHEAATYVWGIGGDPTEDQGGFWDRNGKPHLVFGTNASKSTIDEYSDAVALRAAVVRSLQTVGWTNNQGLVRSFHMITGTAGVTVLLDSGSGLSATKPLLDHFLKTLAADSEMLCAQSLTHISAKSGSLVSSASVACRQ